MPPTTKASTEELEALEVQFGEMQQAVARLSKQLNDSIANVAKLTADVAELKLAQKRTENWAKGQGVKHDNSIQRYE